MIKIKGKIVFAVLLVVLAVLMLASCTKDDGTLEYRSVNGGYEVAGLVDKDASDITVPEKYNGKNVVAIGDGAFRGTNIKSIAIPSTVKSFGLNAFEFCLSLEKVELDSSNSFATSQFDNIYANPLSGGAALYVGGNAVSSLTLDCESVSDYAYAGCATLESVSFQGVKSIGVGAFRDCAKLSGVNFGEGVENIGASAFTGACFEELKLPMGVKSVGHSAFSSNEKLASVSLPESLTELSDRVFFACPSLEVINLENIKTIGIGTFYDCVSLREIFLSVNTEKIEEYAFYNCSGLMIFDIPENSSLGFIGEAAFRGCTSLRDMYLGNAKSLKTVGKHAFEYCPNLEFVTLPSAIEEIGDWAFASCGMLDLTEHDGVGYLGNDENPYILVYKLLSDEVTNVVVPTGAKFVHQGAFFGEKNVSNISLPKGVVSIGSQAFSFCTGLKEITIASTVKSLGDGALMGCTALEKLRYKGPSAQWTDSKNENYVKKGSNWNFNIGSYKIYYG